ncbi:hypothetical protein M407DRAFT_244523 [Tulasnella calospora MUT 4182]|uniref:Uncharacterized protein n=1 Tax=Tulasnella calospora MUT 4182 TaxID=1051891 RepID=A0A0C3LS46_9AGAM|nr:hypothetical protein M407DRAFT_244523 [Tulasnella calospora MUT 4182]
MSRESRRNRVGARRWGSYAFPRESSDFQTPHEEFPCHPFLRSPTFSAAKLDPYPCSPSASSIFDSR